MEQSVKAKTAKLTGTGTVLTCFRRLALIFIIAAVLGGCATKSVIPPAEAHARTQETVGNLFKTEPSDRDLFEEALSYLSNQQKEPNYKEARLRLEKLVREHPDGKWTPAAGALIACIQKIAELQNQLRLDKQRAQSDHGKLAREIEGLRDGIRQTEEKYSAELIRLQQENEQLKKDIQQLKNLEIQLEKREKMLR